MGSYAFRGSCSPSDNIFNKFLMRVVLKPIRMVNEYDLQMNCFTF